MISSHLASREASDSEHRCVGRCEFSAAAFLCSNNQMERQILFKRQRTSIVVAQIFCRCISIQQEILQCQGLVVCTDGTSVVEDSECDIANFGVMMAVIVEFWRDIHRVRARARVCNGIRQFTRIIPNLRCIDSQANDITIFAEDVMCDIAMTQIGHRVSPSIHTSHRVRMWEIGVSDWVDKHDAPILGRVVETVVRNPLIVDEAL